MPFAGIIWTIVTFLIQEVLIKFVILASIFALISALVPYLLAALGQMMTATSISAAFGSISSTVWFFLDFAALDVGIPVLISAHVTRFVIRRIPVIG